MSIRTKVTLEDFEFCPSCNGYCSLACVADNTHEPKMYRHVGEPWSRTIEISKASRVGAIEPVKCEGCDGAGLVLRSGLEN